ncbi:DUF883 C-terminal domain-containing protein [Zhongshania antarctica]|uniref:DUF883 family protein n=1 Tax=Zhongshania antarctica TaxID=641702 RepID=UPI0016110518
MKEQITPDRGRKNAKVTDRYVHENPWLAVGICVGLGLLIGTWSRSVLAPRLC